MNKFVKEAFKRKAIDEIEEFSEATGTPAAKSSNETVMSTNDLIVTGAGSLDVIAQAHAESGNLSFRDMNSTVSGNTGSYTYTMELPISVTNEIEIDVTDPSIISFAPSTGN